LRHFQARDESRNLLRPSLRCSRFIEKTTQDHPEARTVIEKYRQKIYTGLDNEAIRKALEELSLLYTDVGVQFALWKTHAKPEPPPPIDFTVLAREAEITMLEETMSRGSWDYDYYNVSFSYIAWRRSTNSLNTIYQAGSAINDALDEISAQILPSCHPETRKSAFDAIVHLGHTVSEAVASRFENTMRHVLEQMTLEEKEEIIEELEGLSEDMANRELWAFGDLVNEIKAELGTEIEENSKDGDADNY
jgi:hypothetical protein